MSKYFIFLDSADSFYIIMASVTSPFLSPLFLLAWLSAPSHAIPFKQHIMTTTHNFKDLTGYWWVCI